ncbi:MULTISPECIES: chloride channel protein [Thioclava]|uniref:Chloride channel protein n=1 Tax=Thioclava litoralis TaxID=3076557 RepID=A0ABZ1DYP9_9RHOB|nr:chloride channel protein [Thioclava sp. FTW29]
MIFWLGAIAIGVISVGFATAADYAQELFRGLTVDAGRNWLPLIITPLGFLLCAYLALTLFPGTSGSGIPQAIAAQTLTEPGERAKLLSLKMVFGKILLTILGLFSGGSIGREGPTVQIGSAIMLQSASLGGMAHSRGLILAGSAAGIAAAFNTPLAGIVFAIEEMSRSYQSRTNGVVLSAVIIAGIASLSLLGNYTYFGISDSIGELPRDLGLVLVCGVTGGLFGALFSRLVINITRRIRRWKANGNAFRRSLLQALICGIITAVIGYVYAGSTFGTGYGEARASIEGEALPLTFFFAKLIATVAATVSGIPGGLFAPSLAVGAGLGSSIALIMGTNVGLASILGMAGYFAGVVQSPMTAFVIIVEMTGSHSNIVPVMAASMIGYGTARFVSPEPLYGTLARFFIADALRLRRAKAQAARETDTDAAPEGAAKA